MLEFEENIKVKIRQHIFKATLSDGEIIKDDSPIFELGLLNSMGLLYLIDFIKKEFDADVTDNEPTKENFENINNITSFVNNKLQKKNE